LAGRTFWLATNDSTSRPFTVAKRLLIGAEFMFSDVFRSLASSLWQHRLASIGCVRASSYAEIADVILESLRHSPSWYTTCADLMVFVPQK
jgi:hypothetical protein